MPEELNGGAPAPAEVVSTPEVSSNTPEPIAEATPRGAIDRAFAALEGDSEPAAKEPAKAEPEQVATADAAVGERERNPDGTFKAKDATAEPVQADKPVDAAIDAAKAETAPGDAPARFSPDAKALWATAPEPVKAEVLRMEREMTAGLEKYRADATAFDSVREYDSMARQYGTDLKSALDRYVAMDKALNDNPLQGLELICQDKGISLREVAAHILGQPLPEGEQQSLQAQQHIQRLEAQIARLEQGFTGIQSQSIGEQITNFAANLNENDKALFNELDAPIAEFIKQGLSLQDAFAQAKEAEKTRVQRLAANFGFNTQPTPAPTSQPGLSAHTQKGQLSVTGAPSSGSNPSNRKPPSSPRDAIDRAFNAVGV